MSDSLFSKFSGMLLEQGIVVNVGDDLSPSQKRAFDTFKKGENILVLGEEDTGRMGRLAHRHTLCKCNRVLQGIQRLCLSSYTWTTL